MAYYLDQNQDSTCVAVAIVNACRYLGLAEPFLSSLIKQLKCANGDAVGSPKILKEVFGSRLKQTNFPDFMKTGGLLKILHPIFNFHMILCYPDGEGYTLVNSWLGPNVLTNVGYNEVQRFLPKFQHQRECWRFNK